MSSPNRRIVSVLIVSEMLPPGGRAIEIHFYELTFNFFFKLSQLLYIFLNFLIELNLIII